MNNFKWFDGLNWTEMKSECLQWIPFVEICAACAIAICTSNIEVLSMEVDQRKKKQEKFVDYCMMDTQIADFYLRAYTYVYVR